MNTSDKPIPKRWLITGVNGLIGQTLVQLLSSCQPALLAGIGRGSKRLASQQMGYYMLDDVHYDKLWNIVSYTRPDIIVHLAAMTNVDECEINQEAAKVANVSFTYLLLDICKQIFPNVHFIYLSTDFVFDGSKAYYKEEDVRKPVNYYGKTKMLAEDCVSLGGLSWSIIRTSLVYGHPLQSGRKDIVRWVAQHLQNGKKIQLVTDQYRRPTYTLDVAQSIIAIARKRLVGIYHVTGSEEYTPYDIGIKVAEHLQSDKLHSHIMPVSSFALHQKARRPLRTVLAIDKANKSMNYVPSPFDTALLATLRSI